MRDIEYQTPTEIDWLIKKEIKVLDKKIKV